MTNILEGLQCALPHFKFPHWNDTDEYARTYTYYDWRDICDNETFLPKGAKLRPRAVQHFEVVSTRNDAVVADFDDKNKMMSFVAEETQEGHGVSIKSVYKPVELLDLSKRKLQYRLQTEGAEWITIKSISEFVAEEECYFRIRPDFYHIVDDFGDVSYFFDVYDLVKYFKTRMLEGCPEFNIQKVMY